MIIGLPPSPPLAAFISPQKKESSTVMDATADTLTILAQNKLNEQIPATAALIDQTILIRTATNLYSFGASK